MNPNEAIEKAVSIVGTASALADLLGISKGAVSQWKDDGRRVPAEHCPTIERATKGAVKCEDLRPDVDWAQLRTTPNKAMPAAIAEAEKKRNGGIRQHGDSRDAKNISK